MTEAQSTPLEQLKRALNAGLITQDTFDAAIAAMSAQLSGSGAIAQGQGAVAVGEQGVVIRSDNSGDVNTAKHLTAAEGAQIVYGGSQFWTLPDGEPEWVQIPEGEFTMGEPREAHRVLVLDYAISCVPITNAQYQLFVQATDHEPPENWNGKRTPRGKEIHPVVNVSWNDALRYCRWLSKVSGKPITLPNEPEWEKAARGGDDARVYPWGDAFDAARCNVRESGFRDTTPVGIFRNGTSPYGCLDMVGNVWEWTRSLCGKDLEKPDFAYPYEPEDRKREDLDAGDDVSRVVRGGSWWTSRTVARCASRKSFLPDDRYVNFGFRLVLRSAPAP